jgi:hypothetical protein
VDWTNESCEFHIDEVLVYGQPGVYPLPFPWWKLTALRKITTIEPCDWFVVNDPVDWTPDPCTWWEVLDPYTDEGTGYEFHVDDSYLGPDGWVFHVDEVYPDPLPDFPWYPPIVDITAEQKITDIQSCDWFVITDPIDLPQPCTWWEVLDATGAPTGLEFHVDTNDGFLMFHIDETLPGSVISVPPSYNITAQQKIDNIFQCDWFKVDPADTPHRAHGGKSLTLVEHPQAGNSTLTIAHRDSST